MSRPINRHTRCHRCKAPIAAVGRDSRGKCNVCVALTTLRHLRDRQYRSFRVKEALVTAAFSTAVGNLVEKWCFDRGKLPPLPPLPSKGRKQPKTPPTASPRLEVWEDRHYAAAPQQPLNQQLHSLFTDTRTIDDHLQHSNEHLEHPVSSVLAAAAEQLGGDDDRMYLQLFSDVSDVSTDPGEVEQRELEYNDTVLRYLKRRVLSGTYSDTPPRWNVAFKHTIFDSESTLRGRITRLRDR